jgi:P2 family phage major capsid protein
MHPNTAKEVRQYLHRIAALNGVDPAHVKGGHQFTVAPELEQRIREAIAQSVAFLSLVQYQVADNQQGEVLDLGAGSTIAGRTDTSSSGTRATSDPTGFVKDSYFCKQTNFDAHLRYALLDAWRHLPNFQQVWSSVIAKQTGRDMLMTGWHGTSAAATTDRTTNPLLQDVNIGWLQKMRAGNAARWMDEGATTGELRIGPETGADYRNLDHLVMDMHGKLLHPAFHDDPDLRVIIGRSLIDDKYATFIGSDDTDAPTENAAWEMLMLNKRIGGFPAMVAPFLPDRTLLLTAPSNLVIIEQAGTRRRTIRDAPDRDRMEDFNSINQAFGIARFEGAAGAENITYFDEGTWVTPAEPPSGD